MRADHVGAYGYPRPTTPRLDELAAKAVVFESATSTAPWTIPAHYSMFTGLPPSFHGVAGHENTFWAGKARALSTSVPYLPELLARAGYVTDAVVSSSPMSTTFGFHRGFGAYRQLSPDASAVIDAALELVRRARNKPQFLFVHLIDPHAPYLPVVEFQDYSKKFIERFGPRPNDISDLLRMVGGRTPPRHRKDIADVVQLYDAAVAYVDHHLGRLFDGLQKMSLFDRTLIIVTSDHGEAFYEHRDWQHAVSLYEEQIRVPLIVSWPDGVARTVEQPVGIVDLFPTFLSAAGLRAPTSEGANLKSYLDGTTVASPFVGAAEVTVAEADGMRTLISLRAGDVKYIARLAGSFEEASWDNILSEEIYDIVRDPAEKDELLRKRAASAGEFRRTLRDYIETGRRRRALWETGSQVLPGEETPRELETLGYVK